jgi:hypothetical protein
LINGHEYVLRVQVVRRDLDALISVTLDSKLYLMWKGKPFAISPHSDWRVPSIRCVAVGAQNSRVLFRRVRMRMISGVTQVAP